MSTQYNGTVQQSVIIMYLSRECIGGFWCLINDEITLSNMIKHLSWLKCFRLVFLCKTRNLINFFIDFKYHPVVKVSVNSLSNLPKIETE